MSLLALSETSSYYFLQVTFIYFIFTSLTAFILTPLQFLKLHKQVCVNKNYICLVRKFYKKGGLLSFYTGSLAYSLSIGISFSVYPICKFIYELLPFIPNPWLSGIFFALLASLFESIATVYVTAKSIQNQKFINNTSMTCMSIFAPLFIRNTLIWLGITIPDVYIFRNIITIDLLFLVFMFLGGYLTSFITFPLDVYMSRKYGDDELNYTIKNFYHDAVNLGPSTLFSGFLCRGLLMSVYNVVVIMMDSII